MGFFDALLGTNTTDATNNAVANANNDFRSVLTGTDKVLRDTTTEAGNYARQGAADARTSLVDWIAGQGRKDAIGYNEMARDALAGGVGQATGTLAPFVTSGQGANSMFANALGLNGASGNDAARGAFQAGPGYEWQRDQAVDAVARKASALGMAGSGNTLDAITRTASGLADQQWGSWLDRLSGLSTQGQAAAGQTAGYQFGGGQGAANLAGSLGQQLGAMDTTLGTATGNLAGSLGSTLANLQSGLGTNIVGNAWPVTDKINSNAVSLGKAQDSAANANTGIFSSLLGKGLQLGTSLLGL